MTLRILGKDSYDSVLPNRTNVSTNMRMLLAESIKQISREVNFKSILSNCDYHAHTAEQPDKSAKSLLWEESMSAQNEISDINGSISKIAAVDSALTRLYSLCQSSINNPDPHTNYEEEIKLAICKLEAYNKNSSDSKVINLFGTDKDKMKRSEWSVSALQLDKIDLSDKDRAECSLSLISSAISLLAYSKSRAEKNLENKRQIVRELSVARENLSAAISEIPRQKQPVGVNFPISGNLKNNPKTVVSETRKILFGRLS